MDRGTISQFNTDKGMLRLKEECLYWSSGGYSPVSIWWLMLRYIVWSSMKSLILSEGGEVGSRVHHWKLSGFNTDKEMLGLKEECLYWTNGGYSPVSIWWLKLRNIVWSSMKSSILSEGGKVGSRVDHWKLSGFNTDKGMLGLKKECLYWSNGSYSPASIWWLMLRNIVWSTMRSSILSEGGGGVGSRVDSQKLSGFNTDKGMLGLKKECLYWSNGGYSPVSIWWLMLRNTVWKTMRSSILSEGGGVGSRVDRRKLSGFNTDKGMLGLKKECLYWFNGGYSPVSIWWLMLRNIVWSTMRSSILSEGVHE
jgi:hypothetical protein